MPWQSFKEKIMTDELTYWPKASDDGFGGKTWGAAVLIRCRWNKKRELFLDSYGKEDWSRAVAHPWDLDNIEIGGFIALGDQTLTNPDSLDTKDVYEVRMTKDHDDTRGGNSLATVWV